MPFPEDTNLQGALFSRSRFTYLGRNDRFLKLVAGALTRHCADPRVVLMGSGPVEPFGVATIPELRASSILAVDSDADVVALLRHALEWGYLDLTDAGSICVSGNQANPYFSPDSSLSWRQASAVRPGLQLTPLGSRLCLLISPEIRERIAVAEQDAYRLELDRWGDLLFEGFMLINWQKATGGADRVQSFLHGISDRMEGTSVFASTSSYTHYTGHIGEDRRSFLRLCADTPLVPLAGLLMRWAVSSGGVTSQFGSIFARRESPVALREAISARARRFSLTRFSGLEACTTESTSLEGLVSAFENDQDVVGYFREATDRYRCIRVPQRTLHHESLKRAGVFEGVQDRPLGLTLDTEAVG